jgi:hypothetical protein
MPYAFIEGAEGNIPVTHYRNSYFRWRAYHPALLYY